MNLRSRAMVIKKLQRASREIDDATKMLREGGEPATTVLVANAQRYVADAILRLGSGTGDSVNADEIKPMHGIQVRSTAVFTR
jgi:uncharacterized protein YbjQ (UPF0145 family)